MENPKCRESLTAYLFAGVVLITVGIGLANMRAGYARRRVKNSA